MWVYVDGACLHNGTSCARAGYGVWFGNNHPLNCSGNVPGWQTNQRAEIQAAIVAVSIAIEEQMDSLEIYTDSMYVINGALSWIEMWRHNNWLTSRGEQVANLDKWLELDDAMHYYWDCGGDLFFTHVPGHSGVFGNVQADQMARDAACGCLF